MKSQRKWLPWLGFIIAFITFTAAAALILTPASAGGLPLSLKIRSNLSADYRYGESRASLGVFRLSIIGDMLRDMGLGDKEASQHENVMRLVMEGSVPTATALDFEGGSPLTATPTETGVPTATSTETPEPTATKIPTRVPTKTPTKKPTDSPAPLVDVDPPVIVNAGSISQSPGTYGSCSVPLSVTGARITDAPFSSGIHWVKLKYRVYDHELSALYHDYIYSAHFDKCSGGATSSGGWDACYDGPISSFEIRIYPGFSSLDDYTNPEPFKVKVYMLVEDNADHQASHFYGYYQLPSSCDDTAPGPATDTPTATATATGMATSTATASATITPTASATASATASPSPTPSPTP